MILWCLDAIDGECSDSDGGTRSASSEDESDEELTEEAMVMRKGCGCSVNHFAALDAGEVRSHRLSCLELEKAELDGVIIGRLAASVVPGQVTARGKQRSRDRFSYTFGGRKVCVRTFRYVHAIGKDRLTNLQTHYKEKGVEPRVHGNKGRRPRHAILYEQVKNVVTFLERYAEAHGIPQPAAPRGRADVPPTYLPASHNKQAVYAHYKKMCTAAGERVLGVSSFKDVWLKCMPHLKVMTPRTDCCAKCEKYRAQIQDAVTETEKAAALAGFGDHSDAAQREREAYQDATKQAKAELSKFAPPEPGPKQPCSRDLFEVHYTFDFAQQVTLPCQSRQVGPLYFKVPYKVQLFGVCNEALPMQMNYLFGEEDTIGANGTKCHGPNTVISCLHHYFETYGLGECSCRLHADNCSGQNKNKTMLAYLAWRTMFGLHESISLSFMIAGHTRCLVDGCFGMLRRKYRRSDCDCVADLAKAVEQSARCNKAHPVRDQVTRDMSVSWYAWDSYLLTYFRPFKGISKFHHFEFSREQPGVVIASKVSGGEKTRFVLLRSEEGQNAMGRDILPPVLVPPPLSEERKQYLDANIREFMRNPALLDPIVK